MHKRHEQRESTHEQCQLWLPAYARGRGRSKIRLVRHLRGCEVCQQTLEQLLKAQVVDSQAEAPLPPVEDLLAQIDDQPQEGRKADIVRSGRRVRRWAVVRPLWQYAAVTAAAVATARLRRRK